MSIELKPVSVSHAFSASAAWLERAEKLDQKVPAYEKALQLGGLWMQLGSLISDHEKTLDAKTVDG